LPAICPAGLLLLGGIARASLARLRALGLDTLHCQPQEVRFASVLEASATFGVAQDMIGVDFEKELFV
jgi:hypothetical protein